MKKCPVCGSERVNIVLSFILSCEVTSHYEGRYIGETRTEAVPDFVNWVCDDCGEAGELIKPIESLDITAPARVILKVEWNATKAN